ncbi:tetratricopeptide repeat protein [Sphingomonas astaxanthinifaciens]|uniref:Tetratricopeptide repeat-containing protein n=1 Tax=Sphingomonas astaxanthinifaciens DSM 22298 TaxID=1123267 RepID=A0ABQ5Z8A1_9SPHN|nr:tetratricopeptide repeat protein [Sphingomonas astaxanthinifaciens]GLR47701.1 hypothetical protein GCM10007925_14140 [Sphingomonas astaxanthinifaciens DSM 22298]
MSFKAKALMAAFLFTAAAPVPALAAQKQAAPAAAPKLVPSKEAQPALLALQKAANENRVADLPALSQAALAVAKTPTDRYFAYQLQLKPYLTANNEAATLAAIEGMIASGVPTGGDLANLTFNASRLAYNTGALDKASTYIGQSLAQDPNNPDAHIIAGEIFNKQKRYPEAVAALQKAMAVGQATGKTVDPNVSKRAFAIAYNNKLPVAKDLAIAQLKAAPSTDNWRAAIKLQEQLGNYQATDKLDLFRLQRVTNSLVGEGDYYPYVDGLLTKGLPGEAKAVLTEAFAAGKLDKTKPLWKEMLATATQRDASDKSAPNGDVYLGRGDFAKAAAAYRSEAAKGGAAADIANLRLGIALARSGDKAGATAALQSVKGQRAGIASMWLLYLQTAA